MTTDESRSRSADRNHATPARTLVVRGLGSPYETIGAAIAEALPGDTVLVQPGHYRERLYVDKAITIAGDGGPDSVILDADEDPRVVIDRCNAVIMGLTLLGAAPVSSRVPDADNADPPPALLIQGGAPSLHAMVFRQTTGILCNWAAPSISSCLLADSVSYAVSLAMGSAGIIEGNSIIGSRLTGITAMGAATNPLIRGNRIDGGQAFGMDVFGGASPTLANNAVLSNAYAGILIWSPGTNPTIVGNVASDGGAFGLEFWEGAAGQVADNIASRNALGSIFVDSESEPYLGDNAVSDPPRRGEYPADVPTHAEARGEPRGRAD